MFRFKVYRQGREVLLAASDAQLIGQEFRQGRLRLAVSEAFYGTEEAGESALVQQLRACTVANLVGEAVVTLAIRHGFVNADHVLSIDGVPHAQVATAGSA